MRSVRDFKISLPEPTKAQLRGALVVATLATGLAIFLAWRSLPNAHELTPAYQRTDVLARETASTEIVFADELGDASRAAIDSTSTAIGVIASADLFIHVLGSVNRPGVYELPSGSRVVAALEAAGGLKSGTRLGGVNLARQLMDGEQIFFGPKARSTGTAGVPPQSAITQPQRDTNQSKVAASLLINLNTATQVDLESLPGIGPALAGRILDFRAKHGGFGAVAELGEVAGIGPKRLEDIAPFVTV